MTLDTNTGDMQKLAARLNALDAKLAAAIKGARARNFFSLLIAAVAVIVVGAVLYYVHVRFSTEVTPDLAATVVQQYVDENLPTASAQLEKSLKDNAPAVVSEGEKQFRALPGRLQEQFRQSASRALDAEMPDLQNRLAATLQQGLADARAKASEVAGKDDETKFREMVRALASTYGSETMKLVDDVNAQYTKASGDIVNGLTMLAEGKNLSPQQKTQRNLVRDFLVMAKEAAEAK
jgi:hypothetical protein